MRCYRKMYQITRKTSVYMDLNVDKDAGASFFAQEGSMSMNVRDKRYGMSVGCVIFRV